MSDVVIRVENLGKLYRIGEQERYKALRDILTDALAKPFRLVRNLWSGDGVSPIDPADNYIWALKDVSFEVKEGEVIGIIGRNGAGKSTLLKILSCITEPTTGRAEIRGRVGSLLEVGTGFHPELTGRENIYLNGAILGMGKAEIERKFDEIVAFAEVEKFIDTPVKHYSSGMYLRLAFAVAAHLEPEILLVDEVLAVGDAAFQKKCLGKMGEVAREGRTVLFVSHNMEAVTSLCQRGVLLQEGRISKIGPADEVIGAYMSQLGSVMAANSPMIHFPSDPDKPAQILSVALKTPTGELSLVHNLLSPITVTMEYVLRRDFPNLYVACHVRRSDGYVIYGTSDMDYVNYTQEPLQDVFPKPAGLYQASVTLPAPLLNTGIYELQVALSIPRVDSPDLHRNIFFEVVEADGGSFSSYPFKTRRECLLAIPLPWQVRPKAETGLGNGHAVEKEAASV